MDIYKLIEEMGIKAKPFSKVIEKRNDDEYFLFNGIYNYWSNNYQEAIKILSSYEFTSKKFSVFAHIALFEIYFIMQDYENVKIEYEILTSMQADVTDNLRYKIHLQLCWYDMIVNKDYSRLEKIKIDSNNPIVNCYYNFYLSKVELFFKNNKEKGLEYLNFAYEFIKEQKRPYTEIQILNSLTCNINKYETNRKAKIYSEDLGYKIGFWMDIDELKLNLTYIDTIAEINPTGRTLEIYETLFDDTCDQWYKKNVDIIKERKEPEIQKYIDSYLENIEKFKNQDVKIPIEIYMSHLRDFCWQECLEAEMKGRIQLKSFTSTIEKARLEIIKIFMKIIKHKDEFSELYFKQEESTRVLIDKFAINYVRYREYQHYFSFFKLTGIDLKIKNFDPVLTEVVLYLFNETEKSIIIEFFKSFVSALKDLKR